MFPSFQKTLELTACHLTQQKVMDVPSSVVGGVLGESGADTSGESVADRSTFDPSYAPIGSDLDSDSLEGEERDERSKADTAVEANFQ